MYVLPIHIPVYVDDERLLVDASWKYDLLLVRDWLAEPYGGLTLISPSMPISAVDTDVMNLEEVGRDDGIRVVRSFDLRCRTREYWQSHVKQWVADVRGTFGEAKVVHCSAGEAFRPMWYQALRVAVQAQVPTVLHGPDMDPHVTQTGIKGRLYCSMFDRMMRRAADEADLCFFKQGLVYDRYARYARRVESFCHSMHCDDDVLREDQLETRLANLGPQRPLRAVYAGRFVPRKGLADAIAAVSDANARGVPVEFHLFGSGPQENELKALAASAGIAERVIFHGFVKYDNTFLTRLAGYDLLLFMPTEEDTPRMIYDAMAAGLPLVGSRIPFLQYRVKTDRMGLLVDIANSKAAADQLVLLHQDPEKLRALSRNAQKAGKSHSLEQWYRKRADWTQDVIRPRPAEALAGAGAPA